MRRLSLLALLLALAVASAPTADAQFGRLLDRARQAVTGDSGAQDAEAVDAASTATLDGRPAPVLDYSRFLDKRFYTLRGEFYFSDPTDHLIFPPEGLDHYGGEHGEYVVRDAEGRAVARQPIGTIYETASNAFVTLGTRGGADSDGPLATGSYTLDLVFQGRIASRIPFSVEVSEGDDPFDPKTLYRRDGPWRTLAFFEHATERRDYHLTFNAWVHARDLGAENGRVRFVLTRDGEPVATCAKNQCPFVNTGGDWGSFEEHLVTYESRDATNATFFTIDDMTPGAYVMTVSTLEGERPIQSYAFEGGASTIVPHTRSAMDYEPRHAFLTPRRMRGQSLNRAHSLYWVEAAE